MFAVVLRNPPNPLSVEIVPWTILNRASISSIAPLRPTLMTVLLCYPRIPGDHIADVCIIPCIL